MNLYQYLRENIDLQKIQKFKDDEYELAIARYVFIATSKIFYRNEIFFLNEEQMEQRHFIYSKKLTPQNILSFDIVCSSYCALLREILKNEYDIETELIKTDNDVFKHVALILNTKTGNKYFIDPLMDLSEMKFGMKTHNFASKEIDNNPYVRVRIEGLSFLDDEILREIDEKIGYIINHKYLDDLLYELKNRLDEIEFVSDINIRNKLAESLLKRPIKQLEYNNILNFKIICFFELIRREIMNNGIVELMIYVKSAIAKLISGEEKKRVNIVDFFCDECDLKDKDILKIIGSDECRKRGLVLEYDNNCIIFSNSNREYLTLTKDAWNKKIKNNNIFVRKTEFISLYKYLDKLNLEPNILNHREFLKKFKKIENNIINEGKNPKDYISVLDRQKIVINYDKVLEFCVENNLLVIYNKTDNIKTTIFFEDEGRKVEYQSINM